MEEEGVSFAVPLVSGFSSVCGYIILGGLSAKFGLSPFVLPPIMTPENTDSSSKVKGRPLEQAFGLLALGKRVVSPGFSFE